MSEDTSSGEGPRTDSVASPARKNLRVPLVVGGITGAVGLMLVLLLLRAESQTNQVALSSLPKRVTAVRAQAQTFRPLKRYVGSVEPWLEANVGPQVVSAYVREVLVRPGDAVKRGQLLAKLDCRAAQARAESSTAQAKAMAGRMQALADQAQRIESLAQQGYMAGNEAEMKLAESESEKAKLESARAEIRHLSVASTDCALVAPFDGDIFTREVDPGAYLSPGKSALSVVDRSKVRISLDLPESDFGLAVPGTAVRVTLLAVGQTVTLPIARRAPAVDPRSRTVHVEADLPNSGGSIPVHTTASVELEVGTPIEATAIPLVAATVKRGQASLFSVADGKARAQKVAVVGERSGQLFVATSLPAGSLVVTEGRSALEDGDRVTAQEAATPSPLRAEEGPVPSARAKP